MLSTTGATIDRKVSLLLEILIPIKQNTHFLRIAMVRIFFYASLFIACIFKLAALSQAGQVFVNSYHEAINGKWGTLESLSGPGSTLEQTQTIRAILPNMFSHFSIASILDAPCGDFNWMKTINLDPYTYLGIDVVEAVISQNDAFYGSSTKKFICLDLLTGSLPQVDLIISRDFLVHLSNDDVKKVLKNFKMSGSRYLLTTTFPTRTNENISSGQWRPLNLQKAPFNLPQPIFIFTENCTEQGGIYADKSLGLWKLEDICL